MIGPSQPISASSSACTASALVPTTTRGRSSSSGRYSPSSCSRIRSCSAGDTPSSWARSTMMHITRARSTWRRNWCPSPRPSLAPSISPGMSATTKSVSSSSLHDAEVRLERRERIVGDLRLGRRDHADERRLADVREADERDVGHQAKFETQPVLLAVLALLGEAGGAPLVRQELGVAATTPAPGRGEPPIAVVDEFGEQLAGVEVEHRGADRHVDLEGLAATAVEILALAVDTALGAAVRVVPKGEERRHVVVGDQPDAAAVAAVAAVRAAHRDRAFTSEADATGAAIAAACVQLALVDELGHRRQG